MLQHGWTLKTCWEEAARHKSSMTGAGAGAVEVQWAVAEVWRAGLDSTPGSLRQKLPAQGMSLWNDQSRTYRHSRPELCADMTTKRHRVLLWGDENALKLPSNEADNFVKILKPADQYKQLNFMVCELYLNIQKHCIILSLRKTFFLLYWGLSSRPSHWATTPALLLFGDKVSLSH